MHHHRRQIQTHLRIRTLEYNIFAFLILLKDSVLIVYLPEGGKRNPKTKDLGFIIIFN